MLTKGSDHYDHVRVIKHVHVPYDHV